MQSESLTVYCQVAELNCVNFVLHARSGVFSFSCVAIGLIDFR